MPINVRLWNRWNRPALGNATGDANTWCHWLVWSHGGKMVDEKDNVVINSPETIAALEYGKQNIRINAVCPGPIRTPMMGRLLQNRPDAEQRFARSEPLKRLGEPEEIGEAVAWLCSDRASYVTGLPMPVDGGFMAT